MKLKLFLSIMLFCGIINAQTNTELKDFINKNNVAIRSVQKNMIAKNLTSYSITFKEIVKKQEASIKEYSSNKNNSILLAFAVRKECLSFLKTNTEGNLAYFEITAEENKLNSPSQNISLNALTEKEIKMIDDMEVFNFQALNTHILIIQ